MDFENLNGRFGSVTRLVMYDGYPPDDADKPIAPCNRTLMDVDVPAGSVRLRGERLVLDHVLEPIWPEGATFCRFYDDAGNVVIQSEL